MPPIKEPQILASKSDIDYSAIGEENRRPIDLMLKLKSENNSS